MSSKSFVFPRWDITLYDYASERIEPGHSFCESEFDGGWVRAEDAINREAVNSAQIATLEAQLKSARADAKRLGDLIANPELLGMHVSGNTLDIGLKGAGPMLFAQSFSDYFKESGATNFIEMRLTSPDPAIGELLCTLQRVQGETPTQQRNAAQAAAAQVAPIVKFAGIVLKAHRNDGYPGDVDGDVIQKAALDCGLTEIRNVVARCGENCSCAEFVSADDWIEGHDCYFDTHLAKIAKDAAK